MHDLCFLRFFLVLMNSLIRQLNLHIHRRGDIHFFAILIDDFDVKEANVIKLTRGKAERFLGF